MWMNDQEQQECILEGSVYLTDLLSYYAHVEKFYITRSSQVVRMLQDKIIEVYVAILKYSAELKGVLEQRSLCMKFPRCQLEVRSPLLARVIHSLTSDSPLQGLKDICNEKHTAAERLQIDANNESTLTLNSL